MSTELCRGKMTMKKNFDVTKEVNRVLYECVESRDDDYVLFCEIAKNLGHNVEKMQFCKVIELIYNGSIPSFECVSRIRRNQQSLYEELRGSQTAQERREKSETKYRQMFSVGE